MKSIGPLYVLVLILVASWASSAWGKCYVLFTVDVESRCPGSPDLDIWGILPGKSGRHGIERMMNILDQHGVKGTFFVNVYEAQQHGEAAIVEVCRVVHAHGHDLELHTHPRPIFGVDAMRDANLSTQVEILQKGVDLLKRWTGTVPVAHRAGGFLANCDTVIARGQVGIPLELSHNVACRGGGALEPNLTTNKPIVCEGVLCVPVSSYAQASVGNWRSMRFLDIEASSPDEIRHVVSDLNCHDVRTAVIMMHSFSFSQFGRPNLRVERALDELVAGFTADSGVRIVTARQLYEIWRSDPGALASADYVPTTGWWMTYCRAWRRLDEGWKNVTVAAAPPAALVLAGVIGCVVWCRRRRNAKVAA
jgi:peptidoglycan/xylan/chitin deacetylase (PgdA/CDA1 family)